MLDDNRYCGDILIQVAAVESAMQSFGYLILQEHMKTCMTEEVQSGNTEVVDEVLELMKSLNRKANIHEKVEIQCNGHELCGVSGSCGKGCE